MSMSLSARRPLRHVGLALVQFVRFSLSSGISMNKRQDDGQV